MVYGGIGKAARNWECFDAIVASLKAPGGRRIAAGPVGQAGRRVQDARRCAARADRELQPGAALGDLGALQRARPQGPDDVRPDDRRLVDLHRQPGHRAGHLRNVRRGRAPALRRRLVRQMDPDRGPGRHGRRAAARRDHGRRLDARRSNATSRASRCACARAISTSAPRASTKRSRSSAALRQKAAGLRRPARQRGGAPARDRASARTRSSSRRSSPTRPRRTIPSNGYLPAGWTLRALAGPCRKTRARRGRAVGRANRSRSTCTRCSSSRRWAFPDVDYGNNIRQVAKNAGLKDAFDFPGFVPAYIRPLFCEGKGPFRWVALSGDPEDICAHRRESASAVSRRSRTCTAGSTGARAHQVPGPAGAHLLARPRPAPSGGARVQRDGAQGRAEGADRDRPRPPRRRLGREPEPRDRGDARRLRRGVRLAAPERCC